MCPPCYYQSANGSMVAHALKKMMYGYTLLLPLNQRVIHMPSKENNWQGTLSVFLTTYIYYAHLTYVRFEDPVHHESLLSSFIYKYMNNI